MSKLEQRVAKLVATELADLRNIMLDVEQGEPSNQGLSGSSEKFGHPGLKPEVARLEHLVSQIYPVIQSEEDESEDQSDEIQKELVESMLNDHDGDDGQGVLDKVLKWIDSHGVQINFNAPFSGSDAPSAADYAITQGIKAAPLPPWIKAAALVTFGAGKKLLQRADDTIDSILRLESFRQLSQAKKAIKDLTLKVENEVNESRAEQLMNQRKLRNEISKIHSSPKVGNSMLAVMDQQKLISQQLSELRGLL